MRALAKVFAGLEEDVVFWGKLRVLRVGFIIRDFAGDALFDLPDGAA